MTLLPLKVKTAFYLFLEVLIQPISTHSGSTEKLWTFTIVTTDANKQLSWLHDRQPVILSTKAELDTWLNTSSETWSPELSKVVLPYHDVKAPLECYQVPQDVGKVSAESSTFIEPISQRKDGIQAMFAKQALQESKRPSEQSIAGSSKRPTKRTIETIDISDEEDDSPASPKKQKTLDENKSSDVSRSMGLRAVANFLLLMHIQGFNSWHG